MRAFHGKVDQGLTFHDHAPLLRLRCMRKCASEVLKYKLASESRLFPPSQWLAWVQLHTTLCSAGKWSPPHNSLSVPSSPCTTTTKTPVHTCRQNQTTAQTALLRTMQAKPQRTSLHFQLVQSTLPTRRHWPVAQLVIPALVCCSCAPCSCFCHPLRSLPSLASTTPP